VTLRFVEWNLHVETVTVSSSPKLHTSKTEPHSSANLATIKEKMQVNCASVYSHFSMIEYFFFSFLFSLCAL